MWRRRGPHHPDTQMSLERAYAHVADQMPICQQGSLSVAGFASLSVGLKTSSARRASRVSTGVSEARILYQNRTLPRGEYCRISTRGRAHGPAFFAAAPFGFQ